MTRTGRHRVWNGCRHRHVGAVFLSRQLAQVQCTITPAARRSTKGASLCAHTRWLVAGAHLAHVSQARAAIRWTRAAGTCTHHGRRRFGTGPARRRPCPAARPAGTARSQCLRQQPRAIGARPRYARARGKANKGRTVFSARRWLEGGWVCRRAVCRGVRSFRAAHKTRCHSPSRGQRAPSWRAEPARVSWAGCGLLGENAPSPH